MKPFLGVLCPFTDSTTFALSFPFLISVIKSKSELMAIPRCCRTFVRIEEFPSPLLGTQSFPIFLAILRCLLTVFFRIVFAPLLESNLGFFRLLPIFLRVFGAQSNCPVSSGHPPTIRCLDTVSGISLKNLSHLANISLMLIFCYGIKFIPYRPAPLSLSRPARLRAPEYRRGSWLQHSRDTSRNEYRSRLLSTRAPCLACLCAPSR